jgi:hypothetical protein
LFSIPPDLQKLVYYHGIAHGGVEEWDFLYSQYIKAKGNNKGRLLRGLVASRDPWITERLENKITNIYLPSWIF